MMTSLGAYEARSEIWIRHFRIEGKGHNDPADAFRHAFISGLMTQKYGQIVARIAGDMNEVYGEITHLQTMTEINIDLYNNSIGPTIKG